ncbi:hypothetical protein WME98_16025 [Sorangium sp. So ce296]|uniref:hypothetical protein n=1 Tax=Sorangium sp. So ce296 TaxID=3133296 RepID=UPI003F5F55BE
MNQQIGTLGFVFKYRIRSRSYHDKRCFLRAKAWAMAAAAMSARFYCAIERLEDLPVSDRPRSLRTALDTPLARLLEGFVLDPDLESCALIYGDVNDATDALSCDPSRLVAAFLLHMALLGDEPLLALSARRGG